MNTILMGFLTKQFIIPKGL